MSTFKIECEEDGFYLVIDVPNFEGELELARYLITDPEALYDTVKAEIGPWLYERDMVTRARINAGISPRESGELMAKGFHCSHEDVDESGGYDRSDPKHPDWHSVHADHYDSRMGK